MIPLVTAINRRYLPGLKALYNSYKANAGDGFDFYCIVDADLFDEVEALGVKAVKPLDWTDHYPLSKEWPEAIPAMFADMQIPRLFPDHERAVWIDADCIIIKPLQGLIDLVFAQPVAACSPDNENYTLGFVLRNCPGNLLQTRALFGGLIVFNIPEWNKRDITGQCAKAMTDKTIVFRYGDQSVLSYVLRGDFARLPDCWQIFANRDQPIPPEGRILHYVGALPWERKMCHQAEWDKYA
jgi:lipopolysaccharide biosynthesis glycosyltransferase